MTRREEELRQRIEDGRRAIDELDDRLLDLLNRRARRAQEIGRIKGELGERVYQPDREEAILRRIRGANGGPLDDEALKRLFERILDEARRVERTIIDRDNE